MTSRKFRVFAKVGERHEGGHLIEVHDYIDATPAQASAYRQGDPRWRDAITLREWLERTWRRLTRVGTSD